MNAYLKYGSTEDPVTEEKNQATVSDGNHASNGQLKFPESGWENIRKFDTTLEFNLGNVIQYFVTRTVLDGEAAKDVKSINMLAENLFICGRI